MAPVRLGSFELHQLIGRGGMAEVWRGIHVRDGAPVAVKILTAEHFRRPEGVSALNNEVRAMAALSHPHIVMVLDHGGVEPETEEQSQGRFAPGAPYLVMELTTGGTLQRIVRVLGFAELR